MKTVVGLFDLIEDAESAVIALEKTGLDRHDISVMADDTRRHEDQFNTGSASSAEDMRDVVIADATAGAALGGATGLLMALTGLVIPGFGAVVAAGWLVSTLAGAAVGAAAGGLVGALTGAGIPLEDAIYYKEGVKAGATLVAVRVSAEKAAAVASIMEQKGAVNIDERADQYRESHLLSSSDSSVLQQPITPTVSTPTPVPVTNANVAEVTPMVVEEPMPTGTGARIYTHVQSEQ